MTSLAMLVEREERIRNFEKERYYTAHIFMDGMDAATEGIDSKAQAEMIAAACESKNATVVSAKKEKKTVQPPKLYDLTTLQKSACSAQRAKSMSMKRSGRCLSAAARILRFPASQ